jgi:hypothetical protein
MPDAAKSGVTDLPDQDKLVEEIFQHEDQDKNGYILMSINFVNVIIINS